MEKNNITLSIDYEKANYTSTKVCSCQITQLWDVGNLFLDQIVWCKLPENLSW